MQPDNIINFNERRTLRVRDAATYSGLGRTTIFALLKDGRVDSVKIGGSRLVLKASLDKLLSNTIREAA